MNYKVRHKNKAKIIEVVLALSFALQLNYRQVEKEVTSVK